jgi:hypothetical protein
MAKASGGRGYWCLLLCGWALQRRRKPPWHNAVGPERTKSDSCESGCEWISQMWLRATLYGPSLILELGRKSKPSNVPPTDKWHTHGGSAKEETIN